MTWFLGGLLRWTKMNNLSCFLRIFLWWRGLAVGENLLLLACCFVVPCFQKAEGADGSVPESYVKKWKLKTDERNKAGKSLSLFLPPTALPVIFRSACGSRLSTTRLKRMWSQKMSFEV